LNFLTNFAPLREEMFLGLSCDGFQEGDLMQRENEIATTIVDAAFHVHRALGPGLLESAYEAIMVHELRKRGLAVETQVPVPVVYESVRLDAGFRADLIVEDSVIVELKSLEKIAPVHKKQLGPTCGLRVSGLVCSSISGTV
jgi:GxxExxY protein